MPKKSKWNAFLNGKLPYVVLDGVLYQKGVGHVQYAWLCARTAEVHTKTPIRRIGTVPEELKDKLDHRGTKMQCCGPFPL